MSDPVLLPSDLALYLKDGSIDEDRASQLIGDAQTLCANFLGLTAVDDMFPVNCSPVVARVAVRAYVSITSARQQQLAAAGAPFGAAPGGAGGVYLTREDEVDLERAANSGGGGGGGVFTISVLPLDYMAPVSLYVDSDFAAFDQIP